MAAWTVLVTAAVLLVVVALAVTPHAVRWLAARQLHRRLAAQNGLDRDETNWLWRFAMRHSPAMPAAVFVRPSLFDDRADGDGERDPADRRRGIRRKLFG